MLSQTVELVYDDSELDVQTVAQLAFSFGLTIIVLSALCLVCLPGKQTDKLKSVFFGRKVR